MPVRDSVEADADERTSLLHAGSSVKPHAKRTHSPIPWGQFSILLLLQLTEPMTYQVIYPFAPELIRSIGITHGDETRVGYYVGLIQSIFFATEAMTVLHWSRLSDHIGRKPVILFGMVGLALSMSCFGLSHTFWGLVVSRSLSGALNGNTGVLKSMMAEITDSSNIAQAYAYFPLTWSLGGTIGPMIGGSLSRPADRYPSVFGRSEFLKENPYFLPCAISAGFGIFVGIVTLFYLKETVPNPSSIRALLRISGPKEVSVEETASPQAASAVPEDEAQRPLPLRRLLTPGVLIPAVNYAILAIVDIAFRATQPVYYATSIELGGLGFDPRTIGLVLSFYGVVNGIFQIFFFRRTLEWMGTKPAYLAGMAFMLPVFVLFPIINTCARLYGLSVSVWALVILQVLLAMFINFSYGAVFIYITASSPNQASLGAVNGLAQMMVSVTRAMGPATLNSLFALSIDPERHYLGGNLVYYVQAALVLISLYAGSLLPEKTMTDKPQETPES